MGAEPAHGAHFVGVEGVTGIHGAAVHDMMHLVADAGDRVKRIEQPVIGGAAAALLPNLARRRRQHRLARLDAAGRNLPLHRPGDVAIRLHEQERARSVFHQHGDSLLVEGQDVMLLDDAPGRHRHPVHV